MHQLRQHLAAKARHAATVSAKPVYIFRELLHHLDEHRIVAPTAFCKSSSAKPSPRNNTV